MTLFVPNTDSVVQAVTAESATFALPTATLGTNPALRLKRMAGTCNLIWVRFGASGAVTAAQTDSMVIAVTGEPIIIGIKTGSTHVALLADGYTNSFNITQGNVPV
jgi:hypothetical protein